MPTASSSSNVPPPAPPGSTNPTAPAAPDPDRIVLDGRVMQHRDASGILRITGVGQAQQNLVGYLTKREKTILASLHVDSSVRVKQLDLCLARALTRYSK